MPPDPVFFLDRSIGKRIVASALVEAGANVELHDDHFLPDAPDIEWITEVSRRGWVILTRDKRIRYRPLELAAVQASGARLFVITPKELTGAEMGALVVRHLRRLVHLGKSRPGPFVARVSRAGVTLVRLK